MSTPSVSSSARVVTRSLVYGSIVAGVILVIGSVVGLLVAGLPGLASAIVGALLAAVFMLLTAASVVLANRVAPNGTNLGLYFGIIAATWFLKFAAFIVVVLTLRQQPWLNPYLFFGGVVAAVIGSLVADALAIQFTRVPYVGDIPLPGDPAAPESTSKTTR
ncbi:MAG: hypothetical protein V4479_15435 [Actinomycetota bacterium]